MSGAQWTVTDAADLSQYVPLDMANNITDERVRERIAWVDGLGRAYADALDEVRPEIVTDGGFLWDHEPCPRDGCEGELQQQDKFNVMCLTCEGIWTHVKTDSKHYLQSEDFETCAEKQRVATDGGSEFHARRLFIVRDPEDGENERTTVAAGAMLPSGKIVVEWNREAFPEGERTEKNTLSVYGHIQDAQQASGGKVIIPEQDDEIDRGRGIETDGGFETVDEIAPEDDRVDPANLPRDYTPAIVKIPQRGPAFVANYNTLSSQWLAVRQWDGERKKLPPNRVLSVSDVRTERVRRDPERSDWRVADDELREEARAVYPDQVDGAPRRDDEVDRGRGVVSDGGSDG